jgi:hypothetical protein
MKMSREERAVLTAMIEQEFIEGWMTNRAEKARTGRPAEIRHGFLRRLGFRGQARRPKAVARVPVSKAASAAK